MLEDWAISWIDAGYFILNFLQNQSFGHPPKTDLGKSTKNQKYKYLTASAPSSRRGAVASEAESLPASEFI